MWARIDGGLVAETTALDPAGRFHPALIWAACDATVLQGHSATQGNGGAWTFAAPIVTPPPAPTPAQLAMLAIGAGLAISSTGTPALNATYASDPMAQSHLAAEMIALLASGGASFADGTASVAWPDMAGVTHSFTPTTFHAFALAIGVYVANLYKVINGTVSSLPTAAATIP